MDQEFHMGWRHNSKEIGYYGMEKMCRPHSEG